MIAIAPRLILILAGAGLSTWASLAGAVDAAPAATPASSMVVTAEAGLSCADRIKPLLQRKAAFAPRRATIEQSEAVLMSDNDVVAKSKDSASDTKTRIEALKSRADAITAERRAYNVDSTQLVADINAYNADCAKK